MSKTKIFCICYFVIYTTLLTANLLGAAMSTPLMILLFVVMAPFALIGMVGVMFETVKYFKSRAQTQ